MKPELRGLSTEKVNERTVMIDQCSTAEMLEIMNSEDQKVAGCVHKALHQIQEAIDSVVLSLKAGGRLFYIGAGTSGRLGFMDAAECPPTFGTHPDIVQSIIAGGEQAMRQAVEGAEDNVEHGKMDLEAKGLNTKDVVVGIAASGRTPYVIGALKYANQVGATTISLSCNRGSQMSRYAKHGIEIEVGPEVITGSTRLKAATAQKMVLNMISTISMIKMGKVYQNHMVDLNVSNQKLMERAKNMLTLITGTDDLTAERILIETNFQVKPALVMLEAGVPLDKALQALLHTNGFVKQAVIQLKEEERKSG